MFIPYPSVIGRALKNISPSIKKLQNPFGNLGVPARYELVQFEALVDPTDHPNVVKVGDTVDHFEWFKYNISEVSTPDYKDIEYLNPKEFMDCVLATLQGLK